MNTLQSWLRGIMIGGVMAAILAAVLMSLTGCTPGALKGPPNVGHDFRPRATIAELVDRTVQVQALCFNGSHTGSGVVLSGTSETTILATANHVVESDDCLYTVKKYDGSHWPVFRVVHDETHDVALLYTMVGWEAPQIGYRIPGLGEPVVTVGYPYDRMSGKTELTVSRGTVLNIYENLNSFYWKDEVYRISAAINFGSSGGPCFAVDGSLIGLTVGVIAPGMIPIDSHYYVSSVKYLIELEE